MAAAITLAKRGLRVLVVEKGSAPGGGARSAELTRPGVLHDVCAAIHPMGLISPFFKSLPLKEWGVEWIHSGIPLAHPLDGGRAAILHQDLANMVDTAGEDNEAYQHLFAPFVRKSGALFQDLLRPVLGIPHHPFLMAEFGLNAIRPATSLAKRFHTEEMRALFAGNAAHSAMPLTNPFTSAIGLTLMVAAHAVGWPMVKGGSGALVSALVKYLENLGGEVVCDWQVGSMDELPPAKAYLFDTSPLGLLQIAGDQLSESYRGGLKSYRHGLGVFKIDAVLDGPIPWTNPACHQAATVHLGGTLDEIVLSEESAWKGIHAERPFVLLAQPSQFDPSRSPAGQHVVWAYCHVPHGSGHDMTKPILNQIERFAPGFQSRILAIHGMNAQDYEAYNPNCIGGDVVGGVNDWEQLIARPMLRLNPYTTSAHDIFLCSASTPPGGGVHGMCGYLAAKTALRRIWKQ